MKYIFVPVLLAILTLGASCQRSQKKPDVPVVDSPSTGAAAKPVEKLGPPIQVRSGENSSSLSAKPLTSSGENTDARFSPDGTRILFISRARPSHKQAQVYELYLGRMTEKRITFHDGDDGAPVYHPDGQHLLFSSATDEIKEEPYVIDRLMKNYYPEGLAKRGKDKPGDINEGSELYLQSLHGRVIDRLTRTAGFDSDPDVDAKTKRVVFSSARTKDSMHIWLLNGKNQVRLTEGQVIDRSPRFAPDAKAIVLSRTKAKAERAVAADDSADMDLILLEGNDFRKTRALTSGPGSDLYPAWNPNGEEIIFSSNRGGGGVFNLYSIDRAGQCVRRLTTSDFDQLQPGFSPDGKQIVFTGKREGQHHIYVMDYPKPSDCQGPGVAPPKGAVPAASTSPGPAPSPQTTPAAPEGTTTSSSAPAATAATPAAL